MPAREIWERALPVDPGLDFADPQRSRAGRFVHIRTAGAETTEDDELEATVKAGQSDSTDGPGGVRVAPCADWSAAAQHGDRRGAHGEAARARRPFARRALLGGLRPRGDDGDPRARWSRAS